MVARRTRLVASGGFDPYLANGQEVDLRLAVLSDLNAILAALAEPLTRYFVREGSISPYTTRRQRFHRIIANRRAPQIAKTPGGGIRAVWFRITAIYYEVIWTHVRAGAYGDALAVIIQFSLSLIMITIFAYLQADSRPNHLMTDTDPTHGGKNNCLEC